MDNGEALAFSLIDQWQTGNANATAIQSIAHEAVLFGHRHVCLVQIAKAGDWGLRPEQISRDLAAFAVELPHTYVRPADLSEVIVPDVHEGPRHDLHDEGGDEGNCSC